MQVIVDFETCESHGVCAEIAPEVFELRDASLHILQEEPDETLRSRIEETVHRCPTGSIFVVDND